MSPQKGADKTPDDICFLRAIDMLDAIRTKKLSSREVMQAHLKQIRRFNSRVNAMVTLVPEDELMAQASAADEALAHGRWLGPLHGLPVAVKDLHETAGIRTTYGSPLHISYVPDFDCRVVQHEKQAGAIVIGKTNVPEFGLGSQTFNPVFGPTRNPYDLTKTCGGSTGGGAVALACGMVPLADGSDMGGSLRNPPNFCNVVGLRPSPGRVSNVPTQLGWFTLSVPGPVARNVADCAFFLSFWPDLTTILRFLSISPETNSLRRWNVETSKEFESLCSGISDCRGNPKLDRRCRRNAGCLNLWDVWS